MKTTILAACLCFGGLTLALYGSLSAPSASVAAFAVAIGIWCCAEGARELVR